MNYLPKSHHLQKIEHKETFNKNSDLTRGQEINLEIHDKDVVNVVLKKAKLLYIIVCLLTAQVLIKLTQLELGLLLDIFQHMLSKQKVRQSL